MLRVGIAAIGLAMLGLVVWLGWRSAEDPSYIVWFGLASAIVAPVGLACLGVLLRRRQDAVLEDLSSVSEIEDLIARARSEQERLQLLEDERERLVEIVRAEARRQSLEEQRRAHLENAARTVSALEALDAEAELLRVNLEKSTAVPEVRLLVERLEARQDGKLILRVRGRYVAVDPEAFDLVPFGLPRFLPALLRALASWQTRRHQAD